MVVALALRSAASAAVAAATVTRSAHLSAADQGKLANRCLWILKHPERFKKRLVDTCWYVARRIPKLAQAVGQAPPQQ